MVTGYVFVTAIISTLLLSTSFAQSPQYTDQVRPVNGLDNPHDLYEGDCTEMDGSLQIEYSVTKPANPGGFVQVFDKYSWSEKQMVIDCVKMVDRIEDGSGGYPSIVSGGVGKNSVELGYVSQLSVGLKYIVKISYHVK